MYGLELSVGDWLRLLTHVRKWLSNLLRAGQERKTASKEALRGVVRAVRETEVYVRHLREGGQKNLQTEKALALRWTDLSFLLADIKLTQLARRCHIKGQYWADPSRFDQEFLDKAGTKLSEIERLASLALREIDA